MSPSELQRAAGGIAIRNRKEELYANQEEMKEDPQAILQKRLAEHQVGRVVDAKTKIQVPKDLILMKIAQQQLQEQE